MKKDWKQTEKIVKLIEEVLSPNSYIEHDVKLPDLNSISRATRQCDLIIRNGEPPRQTLSIVEIQDRGKKVDITMFDGWVQKMRDVGAQHLICVSKKGFPKSIIEKAMRIGPTVRLITLEQLEKKDWPLNFFSSSVVTLRRELLDIKNSILNFKNPKENSKEDLQFPLHEKYLEINNDIYSPFELIFIFLDYLELKNGKMKPGTNHIDMKLPIENERIVFHRNGETFDVIDIQQQLVVKYEEISTPLKCSTYKQIDYESELAWLLEARINKNCKDYDLKIILKSEENGYYRIVNRLEEQQNTSPNI
jgi:hypothetical protein